MSQQQPLHFDLPEFRRLFRTRMEAKGYPGPLAERISILALQALQEAHGGSKVYIRSASREASSQRQELILTQFTGDYRATAKAAGCSTNWVYQLVRRYHLARREGRLESADIQDPTPGDKP